MKALVVDDSRAMRVILKKILSGAGFDVVEAGNGKEAIDKLVETGVPEVALFDWNMPEMNGFDLLRSVRAQPAYDPMKVVMVTTETEIAQMTKALEAGANEYVMKPFTGEIVLEKLRQLGVVKA